MKIKVKTINGYVGSETFNKNLNDFVKSELNGFKEFPAFKTLRGLKATQKVIIKAWYWRGEWNDPTKEIYAIYYK